MEVVYERCCGLDVHRNMVVACLAILEAGQRRKEIRTCRTITKVWSNEQRVKDLADLFR